MYILKNINSYDFSNSNNHHRAAGKQLINVNSNCKM